MISLILATAARAVQPLLLLFSLFLLLRGHNDPGGGFAGGLVAAAAFILIALAYDSGTARRSLRVDPRHVFAAGLLVAGASGVAGMVLGAAFLTGVWLELELVGVTLELGTPLLFDIGVYLTVVGVTLTMTMALFEAPSDVTGDAARQAAIDDLEEP